MGLHIGWGNIPEPWNEKEDNQVRKHNDAARRLNEKSGQYLMFYKRNRYTNAMPLSPGGNK